ncbi:MAG: hypothetical protein R3F61_20005 [Myxococcota bacterium]
MSIGDIREYSVADDFPPDPSDRPWVWYDHQMDGITNACVNVKMTAYNRYGHVYLSAGPIVGGSQDDYTVRFSLYCVDHAENVGGDQTCTPGDVYKIKDITKTNVNIDSPSTIFKLRPDWAGVLKFPSPTQKLAGSQAGQTVTLLPGVYRMGASVVGTAFQMNPEATVFSQGLYRLDNESACSN